MERRLVDRECDATPSSTQSSTLRPSLLAALMLAVAGAGLFACAEAQARTWYVAPSGDDSAAGSKSRPFATWQRAIDLARSGDTINVAAGTYRVRGARNQGVVIRRNGSKDAPITLRGTGGRAVLDCSGMTARDSMYCLALRADWWQLQDIEVRGVRQPRAETWSIGILLDDASHNDLRRVASHDHQGSGFMMMGRSAGNRLIDCDAYRNYDPLARPRGGDADGIAIKYLPSSATGNEIIRCRTRSNSDDGIDLWLSEAPVTIRSSWSFRNGWIPGTSSPGGDGVGFKLGRNRSGPRHHVVRNVSAGNRYAGFDSNDAAGPLELLNNSSLNDGVVGFSLPEPGHWVVNNVTYGKRDWLNADVARLPNGTSLLGPPPSSADFQSISTQGLDSPRGAGGALPVLGFARPKPGHRLIDRGRKVGLDYRGRAPDLGAYEVQ